MRRAAWLALVCCLWLCAAPAPAHNLTISVLRVQELGPGEFVTSWQQLQGVLDAGAAYLLLRPVFPEHCRFEAPYLQCGSRGLTGRMGFLGLGDLSGAAIIQLERRGAAPESVAFSAAQPQKMLTASPSPDGVLSVASGFVAVGVEHIALGFDHLAFVLGLLWLVRSRRALVKTITAFTLGHSLTLGAAALGYVEVPTAPVEAVIALSIGLVAVEALKLERDGCAGLSARAPYLVAVCFGLLHGLGFANAFAATELPHEQLPCALLGFNVGVELGQLAFVALVYGAGALWRRLDFDALRVARLARPAARYGLGSLSMYWFIERMAALVAL